MAKAKVYNADSLKSLKFPENVRHRPGVYVGSKDEPGLRRCWKEIIDNSVDEHQEGHGKRIVTTYDSKTRRFTLADAGRGVPSGFNKKENKSGFEIVFATLHGSGKFDQSNYATSSGLNGLGAACAQALSSEFQAWSSNSKSGKWQTQKFAEGYAKSKVVDGNPPLILGKPWKSGTVISWVPDKKVFGSTLIDYKIVKTTCRDLAMLNPGLEIVCVIDGKIKTYKSENGLLDMIYSDEQKAVTLGKPFNFQAKGLIDIAVTWQDDAETCTFSYVNSSHTPEEGTHVQGARNAIVEALKAEIPKPAKQAKATKGKKSDSNEIEAKNLLKGIRLALNYRMANPVYSGQTKDKLTNTEVITQVKNIVLPEFASFLKKNPKFVSMLIDRAKKFQKLDEKFNNDMKAVKSITLANPNARGLLPGKLAQATGKYKPEDIELFLVEGDSAAGPAKESRLPWQEVLALKGKILNAARAELSQVLSSDEVMDIITAIGAKPGDDCKTVGGNVRIGKILIMTDADSDGKHICSLLIALFAKYFRPWLSGLKIGYVKLPLFVGAISDHKEFGFTLDEMLNKFPEAKRKSVVVNRLKGLGEMTNTELYVYGLDPETRTIQMLSTNDEDIVEINKVMGEDVAYRKEFLGIKVRGVKK